MGGCSDPGIRVRRSASPTMRKSPNLVCHLTLYQVERGLGTDGPIDRAAQNGADHFIPPPGGGRLALCVRVGCNGRYALVGRGQRG